MIVIDANVMVAALIDSDPRCGPARRAMDAHGPWYAPAHMPVEVVRTFVRLNRAGLATAEAAEGLAMQMYDGVGASIILSFSRRLLPEIWQLRHNISPYDAAYVALAKRLSAPLLTADRRLAKAAGDTIEVITI